MTKLYSGDEVLDELVSRGVLRTVPENDLIHYVIVGDSARDQIPYKEIVDAYHTHLPMLSRVRTLTNSRKAAIRSRWNESAERQNLVYWNKLFADCAKSAFLTGANDRGWEADFDFFMQPKSLARAEEGYYTREQRWPQNGHERPRNPAVGTHWTDMAE